MFSINRSQSKSGKYKDVYIICLLHNDAFPDLEDLYLTWLMFDNQENLVCTMTTLGESIVWIETLINHRRKGFATTMIEYLRFLKFNPKSIAMTPEGKGLLKKLNVNP